MKPFRTLVILPDFSHNRFGSMTFGASNIAEVRGEVATLLDVAAAACGCSVESLTHEKVAALDLERLRTFSAPAAVGSSDQ